MERLEELLRLRVEDGLIDEAQVMPLVLVSARPRYEASQEWFTTRSLELVYNAFGGGGIRICEACMAPRAHVEDGRIVYQTGPVSLDEVVRLDEQARGQAPPARSAVWIEEQPHGVSIRIVDLRTGRVLFAQNVDPTLVEVANTRRLYTLAEELERRARGDSLTQAFGDFALFPRPHISLDWTDQWGKTNASLTGVTFSVVDPIIGLGICHYQRVNLFNALIGGKAVVSLPTAVARAVSADTGEIIDPLLTGVAVVRVPFGRSNYGLIATASTNGAVGVGLSLMNVSLIPVLP